MVSRGYTLIEMMVAVAMLGIGVGVWISATGPQQAAARSEQVESIARVLDQEMERMRICETSACVRSLATSSATTSARSPDGETWVRAWVTRTVSTGPNGTLLVTVTASTAAVKKRRLDALLWVRP